jgi:tetratricopeptide (TPR) repeat protein
LRHAQEYKKGDLDGVFAGPEDAISQLLALHAEAYSCRGLARQGQGDLIVAIADFTKAIELDPKSALFYANRASALLLQGKAVEAQHDFDRALKLDPDVKYLIEEQTKVIKEQRAEPKR